MRQHLNINGALVFPGFLDQDMQGSMLADIRNVVRAAPLFRPTTKRGQLMSVRMTAAGTFGWYSDHRGYRYESCHPSGCAWPPIPVSVLNVWRAVSDVSETPQCCLVNFYDANAKMGLHQDRDEARLDLPVVSISLGDDALFRVGGTQRGGKTKSVWLKSGDVAVLAGAARLAYHGIDRVRFGSAPLLPSGGRINLTLRVVT